jgi:transcriptional regulator with XRE-family HTH domain
MAQHVDQKQLQKLLAEKLPQREIARRLNIARSTLQRMIKGIHAEGPAKASASAPGNGLPVVDTRKLTPVETEAVRADFWELIEWWRERKLQRVYESTPRETARQTYHVEKRYIRLIHHEAETEGVSITDVINRAFRAYFDKSGRE